MTAWVLRSAVFGLTAIGIIGCTSSRHPYAHLNWTPAPKVPIRSLPLRPPYLKRLRADQRAEAATVIAATPLIERAWLRFAFADLRAPGQAEFVIFSTSGLSSDGVDGDGKLHAFKQLNSGSCNAGYDPIENATEALSMCVSR